MIKEKKGNLHCKWKIIQKERNELIKEKSEIFTAENDPEKHDRNCKRKNEIFTANGKSSRKTGMK